MIIYKSLRLKVGRTFKEIDFGEANLEEELHEIFVLRYVVYKRKGYINPERFNDEKESDKYDELKKSKYFIARLDKKIIGTIRLILDDILPTEKYFDFIEPPEIKKILRRERAELGRFIIIPPNQEKSIYLPRNLVMLFILATLVNYGENNNIKGGFSFIKRGLERKMRKLGLPIKRIRGATVHYPRNGVLYRYFTDPADPVNPFYFITADFKKYLTRILENKWMFSNENDKSILLKSNLYTNFLRSIKVI